jgi:NDP-sugar pyrophosphorylase family protein
MIGKNIYGNETEGNFIDIGTPESYAQAEAFFEQTSVLL